MRSNTQHLPGGSTQYVINDQAKRYTLLDHAFSETKHGNFQYERILSTTAGDKTAPKLKIAISADFSDLTINTVTPNGLRKIDLYADEARQSARVLAEYYLSYLVEEHVLSIV